MSKPSPKLTQRQQMVLDYITHSISDRGYPPTLREIGSHMGIRSTNGVNDHLRALERKGYLTREDMKARALKPIHADEANPEAVVTMPLLRRIAAGKAVLDEENIEAQLTDSRHLVGAHNALFSLRVRGDAMSEKGSLNGDIVVVRKQMHAETGDIVVALLADEAVVREFSPEGSFVQFLPANPNFAPILMRREDFAPTQLIGVVTGVFRRLEAE